MTQNKQSTQNKNMTQNKSITQNKNMEKKPMTQNIIMTLYKTNDTKQKYDNKKTISQVKKNDTTSKL